MSWQRLDKGANLQLVTQLTAGRRSSSSGEVSSLAWKALACVQGDYTLSLALPSTRKVIPDASLPVSLPAAEQPPTRNGGEKRRICLYVISHRIDLLFFFFFPHE